MRRKKREKRVIDTNLRRLRRVDDHYTLMAEHLRQKIMSEFLCDKCGRKDDCSTYTQVSKMRHVISAIIDCSMYMAPLKFQQIDGTDGEGWNTIRLSGAWSQRVREGDTVVLVNKFNERYGTAIVRETHDGDKDEILKRHSKHNHLMKNSALKKSEMPAELERILRNAYGPRFYEAAKKMSVIYLDTEG